MAAEFTPWLGSFVLTTANTAYQLSELVAAAPASHRPMFANVAQFIAIQSDPVLNGSAVICIGNSMVATTDCGCKIFAGQTFPIYSMDANLIRLSNIWLVSDTNSSQVNVSFITR